MKAHKALSCPDARDAVAVKIIVGLGNPGLRYGRTRHNVGFMVVDAFARAQKWAFRKTQYRSITAQGLMKHCPVLLMKPRTYMNLSGEAVAQAVGDTRVALSDILIVSDDADLPVGTMRLKRQGSSGGQRGLSSVIAALQTEKIPRLRIGIGKPDDSLIDLADYVLAPFEKQEREVIFTTISHAVSLIRIWIEYGIDEAIQKSGNQ